MNKLLIPGSHRRFFLDTNPLRLIHIPTIFLSVHNSVVLDFVMTSQMIRAILEQYLRYFNFFGLVDVANSVERVLGSEIR